MEQQTINRQARGGDVRDMQSLYGQYRHTLQGLLDRRAQLAGELGETVRRVRLLDQEIDEVFEVLHLLRGYVS